MSGARVLLVDNYDSFVYNLAQSLGSLGAEPIVIRNDRPVAELEACEPDAVVISPGPGAPQDAGVSVDVVKRFAGRVPILGVCLGHQCIAAAYGGRVERAPGGPVHGKTSEVTHDGAGVFVGLPSPLVATRYHSLAVPESSVSVDLQVTAWSEDGTVMGLRHGRHAIEGVQFHPESVLTAAGDDLVANFLDLVSQREQEAAATRV